MEKIREEIKEKARQALASKEVDVILAWEKGELWYDSYPAFFTKEKEIDSLVWDSFCVNNLSKYLLEYTMTDKKIGVFVKGCDALAFNQLVQDNRVSRDKVVLYGLPCSGMVDPDKVRTKNLNQGLTEIKKSKDELIFITKDKEITVPAHEVYYDKCLHCRYPNPVTYDQLVGETVAAEGVLDDSARFSGVEELEELSCEERFEYWDGQFSKCIRCFACRNVCPACSCKQCTFDDSDLEVLGKAREDSEDKFFHLIRAYHVAGRCIDCGECSRVCPQDISLEKLNRKLIKDINELYGEYQAGLDPSAKAPLGTYKLEDADSFTVSEKGGKKREKNSKR